jgi:hypothetical protein
MEKLEAIENSNKIRTQLEERFKDTYNEWVDIENEDGRCMFCSIYDNILEVLDLYESFEKVDPMMPELFEDLLENMEMMQDIKDRYN